MKKGSFNFAKIKKSVKKKAKRQRRIDKLVATPVDRGSMPYVGDSNRAVKFMRKLDKRVRKLMRK